MKRTLVILMSVLMMLALFAGCSKTGNDATPSTTKSSESSESNETAAPEVSGPSGEITVIVSEVGNNLDPVIANYRATSSIVDHVYDNLLEVNENFEIVSGAFATWNQVDDVTYTFTPTEGMVFQNGDAATVDDYVYSLTRLADVAQAANVWSNIDSVTGQDNTVTVKVKSPDSSFLRYLTSYPLMDKSYCEEAGEDYANAPVGTGPYKVAEYVPGEKVVLEAWTDYPFEQANIAKITFKGISESAAAYMALEAGDADFTEVSYTDFERAQSEGKFMTYSIPSTYTSFVCMNTTIAPFDNPDVRRAMAYAYNANGYLALSSGGQSTIDSMFPQSSSFYSSSPDKITYDLDKAKELLEAAGYNEDNPLKFVIAGYKADDSVVQAYQADLASIGVEASIETYEFGTFLTMMSNQELQMLTGGWSVTTGDPLGSAECYWSGSFGSMNISFYTNDECDELYTKLKSSSDEAEMKEACKRIQDIAWQEVPMFPTYTEIATYAYNSALSDMTIFSSGMISFRHAKIG